MREMSDNICDWTCLDSWEQTAPARGSNEGQVGPNIFRPANVLILAMASLFARVAWKKLSGISELPGWQTGKSAVRARAAETRRLRPAGRGQLPAESIR